MRDFEDFGERMQGEIPEKTEDKDRIVPYYEVYENDEWAEKHNSEPIVFDWSRICELDAIEEDKKWYDTPFYRDMCKKGYKHTRWLVSCPTHGYFKQIVMDPPTPKLGTKCQKCVTDEINRIIALRAKRDKEYQQSRMEERA